LLEPDARKRARPVLKGARRRKTPGLPDGCGSRVGPVVLTAGDRQIVRSPQRRPPTDDRQLARPLFHKDEPRNTGDADLPSLLSRFRSRARRRRPTSATTAELCEPRRVAAEAREVAAGGFLMDAGPGT
jgi:hypothetical protein